MKKQAVKFLITAVAVAGLSLPVLAQSNSQDQSSSQAQSTPEQGEKHHHGTWNGQMPSVDERVQHLTKMLNLTSDQQGKVKTILEEQQQQMQSLKQDTSMSQQDRHAKMKQMHEDTKEKINGVLTTDQKAKWEKMQERRMHHMDKQGAESQKQ